MSTPTPHAETTPGVLVVDDEPMLLEMYTEFLNDACDVTAATGGEDALQQLDDSTAVVLLDRRMSGMNGEETLRAMRQRSTTQRIAIVSARQPVLADLHLDFDEYVVKPTTRTELVDVVDRLHGLHATNGTRSRAESLATRIDVFREHVPADELARSDEFAEMRAQLASVTQHPTVTDSQPDPNATHPLNDV